MTEKLLRGWILTGVVLSIGGQPARAQMVEARAGWFWDSLSWTTYQIGISQILTGMVGVQLHGDFAQRAGAADGALAGVGADLTLFRRPVGGPYLVAGLSGGMGSESTQSFSDSWGSWSAGAGYDLFPLSAFSVGAEGRWRELSLGGGDGFQLALGAAYHFGRNTPPTSPPPAHVEPVPPSPEPPLSPPHTAPLTLADSVVATAMEAMGRPYEYGGTGQNGEGFDCSGLIQYAYARHGIALPRRSVDQARQGKKVDRTVPKLRPGDILTFSNHGGQVTHVGLYMGAGRFIHSATRGVQISTLSPEDPYGRWWYQRWIGVRRVAP